MPCVWPAGSAPDLPENIPAMSQMGSIRKTGEKERWKEGTNIERDHRHVQWWKKQVKNKQTTKKNRKGED